MLFASLIFTFALLQPILTLYFTSGNKAYRNRGAHVFSLAHYAKYTLCLWEWLLKIKKYGLYKTKDFIRQKVDVVPLVHGVIINAVLSIWCTRSWNQLK